MSKRPKIHLSRMNGPQSADATAVLTFRRQKRSHRLTLPSPFARRQE